ESSTSPILIQACSGCPYTIGFDGTGSTNNTACGDLTYAWTIVDPTASTTNESTSTINYDFEECGTHTVTLTVTDGCGNTDSEMVVVVVSDTAAPTVSITGSPGNITACSACPYPATFGSTVTGGATCGDITYTWSMTKPATAADFSITDEPTVDYSFEVCGTYVINLDITDGCGKTAHDSVTLEVSAPGAPTAAFTYSPPSPDSGDVITFDASGSTSGSFCGIVTYDWYWDDGNTDLDITDPIITHTYTTSDTFDVILIVTDGCGETNSTSESIFVGGGGS
ncbi:MAG TPA: PKD domain-containing protein, partial [Candidatus Atribacteria bacterium]|nr:PKD domain-containing protein [Candidatus Atribacteria bacterium]